MDPAHSVCPICLDALHDDQFSFIFVLLESPRLAGTGQGTGGAICTCKKAASALGRMRLSTQLEIVISSLLLLASDT
jgi:hypothetical protein